MLRLIHATDRPVSWTMSGSSPNDRVEPLDLDMTKKALRITSTSDELLVASWIAAARSYFEEQTGRQAVDAVWEWGLDCPPCVRTLQVPRPPLVEVESITYDDANGDEQTLDPSAYRVLPSILPANAGSPDDPVAIDPHCAPGRIEMISGIWPATNGRIGSLRIRRRCGYGASADKIPQLLQAALYLLVGHFYAHREEVTDEPLASLPMGAAMIIQAFKDTAITTQRLERHDLGAPFRY